MSGSERRLAFRRGELMGTRENVASYKKHVEPVVESGDAKHWFNHGMLDIATGEFGPDTNLSFPHMEKLYEEGKYIPLEMKEAVHRSAEVFKVFETAGLRVIRMGLHPSEGLLSGEDLVAGPFHEAFRELVMTEIWSEHFAPLMKDSDYETLELFISPAQFNFAIGYGAKNKKSLLKFYNTVVFRQNENLKAREYHADYR